MRRAQTLEWSIPALALMLWFGATLFYLGDTGRYSDDHAAHLRTPLTGEVDWSRHPWQRWNYFWRPLHLAHCTIVNTLSWNHPWIGHVELALIHAGVGLLLRGLLIRLGIRSAVAGGAALLFVLCPLTAEAALWTSASCNAISSLLLLVTLELVRRQATQPHSRVRVAAIGALGFIIPCWYEPAAAALAAIPLVYLAACPPTEPWRAHFTRIAAPTLLCAAGCILYNALLLTTAPTHARGSLPTIATPHELPHRISSFARMAADLFAGARGRNILLGSITHGVEVLHSTPGTIWLIAIALLTALVSLPGNSRSARSSQTVPAPAPKPGSLLLVGIGITLASALPVLISDAPSIDLRTLYVPLVGIAIALAGIAHGIATLIERRFPSSLPALRIAAGAITLAAATLGAIGMIGFQTQFRTIDRTDQRILAQLRDAFPNPAPGTTFLPLSIAYRGARTGFPLYDNALHSGLELPSHATTMLRFALHRTDISCVGLTFRLEGRVPINTLGPDGFHIARTRAGALSPTFVPWDKTIPFVVDSSGTVSFVDLLAIGRQSDVPLHTRPTLVHALPHDHPRTAVELVENPGGTADVRIVNSRSRD